MRDTINKQALIDHLNSAANELYEKGAIVPSGILVILRDEIEEGKFDTEPAETESAAEKENAELRQKLDIAITALQKYEVTGKVLGEVAREAIHAIKGMEQNCAVCKGSKVDPLDWSECRPCDGTGALSNQGEETKE